MQSLNLKEKLAASKKEMGIDENNSASPENLKQQDPKIEEQVMHNVDPLLFVNGKLNKADHEYVNKNFFVHKGLYNDITAYCRGMDTAIFNYLLHLGLDALKQEKIYKNVDINEVETRYQ